MKSDGIRWKTFQGSDEFPVGKRISQDTVGNSFNRTVKGVEVFK